MTTLPAASAESPKTQVLVSVARRKATLGTMWRSPAVIIAMLVLAAVVLFSIVPQLFAPGDPLALDPSRALTAPDPQDPFGTDQFGRSILSQIIHGSRNALLIGILSVLIGLVAGGVIGLLSGSRDGATDMLLMRGIDVLMLFPGLLLALLFAAALGPSLLNEIVAVGIASIPHYARVARGQVIAVRSLPFIDAAHAIGIPGSRILWRHILPNATAPLVVLATIGIGTGIVFGATLSFLGLGPTTGVPDWGRLLASGQPYLSTAWWISTFPGLVITAVVISVNILGDRLRDVFDVNS